MTRTAALALAAALAAPGALAQTVAVSPSQLTLQTLASPAAPRRRSVVPMFSLRVAFGGGLALTPESGGDFLLRGTVGSRVFFPTSGADGWMVGSDFGVDATWGLGQRDATLLSLGPMVGHLWGLNGVAWAPRVLYGWRDGGDTVWGVRNGIRMLVVAGLFDVELAHQYVAGDLGDEHQMQLAVGTDFGLITHLLASIRAPEQR
ncbi:MAG: hypothetical protein U0324_27505 [Polyangiales bacterium]